MIVKKCSYIFLEIVRDVLWIYWQQTIHPFFDFFGEDGGTPIIIGAPRRDCISSPLVVEHSYGSHGPYSSTIYLLTSESFRCNVEITRGVAICCKWKIIFRSWWLFAGWNPSGPGWQFLDVLRWKHMPRASKKAMDIWISGIIINHQMFVYPCQTHLSNYMYVCDLPITSYPPTVSSHIPIYRSTDLRIYLSTRSVSLPIYRSFLGAVGGAF